MAKAMNMNFARVFIIFDFVFKALKLKPKPSLSQTTEIWKGEEKTILKLAIFQFSIENPKPHKFWFIPTSSLQGSITYKTIQFLEIKKWNYGDCKSFEKYLVFLKFIFKSTKVLSEKKNFRKKPPSGFLLNWILST